MNESLEGDGRVREWRSRVANALMAVFVASTSAGAALLWSLGAGLLALGVSAALVGYLLGAE